MLNIMRYPIKKCKKAYLATLLAFKMTLSTYAEEQAMLDGGNNMGLPQVQNRRDNEWQWGQDRSPSMELKSRYEHCQAQTSWQWGMEAPPSVEFMNRHRQSNVRN